VLAMACASMAAFAGQTVPGGKWSWVWTDRAGSGLPMRVYTYRPRQCDTTCPIVIALHGMLAIAALLLVLTAALSAT